MFIVEPIKPYSQTLLCQALKKHKSKQANLSSESEHVQSGQPSHRQEGERLQTAERRKAAIAHNHFPVLCAHEKKELENVSGIAQGAAGIQERT